MVVVVANRAVEMRDGASLDFVGQLRRLANNVKTYAHRRRVQRRLENLDDRMLADIGIERYEIRTRVWAS